jgi:hypothetical protein
LRAVLNSELGDRNPELGDRNPEARAYNAKPHDGNAEAHDRNTEAHDSNATLIHAQNLNHAVIAQDTHQAAYQDG